VLEGVSFLARQSVACGGILTLGLLAGAPVARRLGLRTAAGGLAWALAIGLALWAELLFLLGAAGVLRSSSVLVAVVAAMAWGSRSAAGLVRSASAAWREALRSHASAAGLLALFFVVAGIAALYPPFEWDETIYHLAFAQSFARSGALPFLEQLRVPVFPALHEVLAAGVLLFADDVATHWIPWWATIATALVLFEWAASEESVPAWAAPAVYLGTPMVVFLSGLGYVDATLTLWTTAALAACARAIASGRRWWIAVAGLTAGAAAGTKYLGVFFVGWVGLELCARWRNPARSRGAAVAIFAGTTLAIAGPVYLRIFAKTGNPLFPFYAGIVGGTPWTYDVAASPRGPADHLVSAVLLPWRSLFDRTLVGEAPPLSPLWLGGLILAAAGAWRLRRWRWMVAMTVAYLWFVPANARYLLPLLPATGLAGADTAWRWASPVKSARRVLAAVAGLALVAGVAYAGLLLERRGPLPMTSATREAFLTRELECYSVLGFLRRTAGERAVTYGLYLERLQALAPGRWYGDAGGPWSFPRVARELARDGADAPSLREIGAGHLVMPRRLAGDLVDRMGATPIAFADDACLVYRLPWSAPP
jgi:4-amino-4-deoxy-L-arabinose transferase-like glycosyltransferase